MHNIHVILADLPGLGRIRLCECNSIQVRIGPVTINLEPSAFHQMADLMASAAGLLTKIEESRKNECGIVPIFQPFQSQITH